MFPAEKETALIFLYGQTDKNSKFGLIPCIFLWIFLKSELLLYKGVFQRHQKYIKLEAQLCMKNLD